MTLGALYRSIEGDRKRAWYGVLTGGAMMAMPLLYPKMRNELSVEGARFARRNFGWTGIAKRMIEVFKSSINQNTMESNIFY